MDNAIKLTRMQKEVESLKTQAAVARSDSERIKKELEELIGSLEEFGVSDFGEAEELLEKMEEELDSKLTEAEEELSAIRDQ